MRPVTLVYCIKNDGVLLGYKKRGFGADKLNGYGGKVHSNETLEDAAIRELKEESGMDANSCDLEKVAVIDFYFSDVPKEKDFDQTVHVYFLKKWVGEPKETEEMRPEWHTRQLMPLEKMWVDDPYWLPDVLRGKKLRGIFTFEDQGAKVQGYAIKYLGDAL